MNTLCNELEGYSTPSNSCKPSFPSPSRLDAARARVMGLKSLSNLPRALQALFFGVSVGTYCQRIANPSRPESFLSLYPFRSHAKGVTTSYRALRGASCGAMRRESPFLAPCGHFRQAGNRMDRLMERPWTTQALPTAFPQPAHTCPQLWLGALRAMMIKF